VQSTAKASTKSSAVDATTRNKRRGTAALYIQALLRAEVRADKARMVRKRIHQSPTPKALTITYQVEKTQTGNVNLGSSGHDFLSALQRPVCVLPRNLKIQDVTLSTLPPLPLSNDQEIMPRYTWRDCEPILRCLDAEPEPLPKLEAAALRYRALVRSDV
jgi:hypothetical protein